MCKVSFVIRTLNEALTIRKVIDSINSQSFDGGIEIVIVDSGSTDGTLEQVSDVKNVNVYTISGADWSWGRALNVGIQNSTGEYIFIISGHCFLGGDSFISSSLNSFSFSKNIMAVYGRQVAIPKHDPFEEWELYNWYPDVGFKYIQKAHQMIGVSNACCVLRREGWEHIKFNEEAQSLEDAIWALNMLSAGYSIAYNSDVWLYHSHQFNVNYIYRKWFSRVLQALYFNEKFFPVSLKRKTKAVLKKFNFLFFIMRAIEKRKLVKFLRVNYNGVLDVSDIDLFLNIKYSAIINANKCYKDRLRVDYWSVKQDESMITKCLELQEKIRDM